MTDRVYLIDVVVPDLESTQMGFVRSGAACACMRLSDGQTSLTTIRVSIDASEGLTGTIEHVMHQGDRTVPLASMVGSTSGSHASICSLNNAASTLTVDERLI